MGLGWQVTAKERDGCGVNVRKKVLIGVAIAIASIVILFLPLSLGLMAGFPFGLWSDEAVDVGARATFDESADCLLRYANAMAGREFSVKLDNDRVAHCFPEQTPTRKKALIACFNTYERQHPDHAGWPEDNMRGCAWAGRPAFRAPFAFGKVVAVPAVPRAGRHFLLKIGTTGKGAIETGTLFPFVTIDGYNGDVPRDVMLEHYPDGNLHLSFTLPNTSKGRRLTIELTTPPGKETLVRKTMTFTVAP